MMDDSLVVIVKREQSEQKEFLAVLSSKKEKSEEMFLSSISQRFTSIRLDTDICNKLSIPTAEPVTLTFGRNNIPVRVMPIQETDELVLPLHVSEQLCLPDWDCNLAVSYDEDSKTLMIGPVIGLVTELRETHNNVNFGNIHDFCNELDSYCKRHGYYFFVCQLSMYHKDAIEGYVKHDDAWVKTTVPHPDVIHNRIHSRKREQSPIYQAFLSCLQEQHIPIFNDRFLHKWEVHDILQKHEYLHPYLPETYLLNDKQTLENMLQRHQCLFLKPVHGSQGQRIYRVMLDDEKIYMHESAMPQVGESQSFDTVNSLFYTLKARISKTAYIVQACVPLLEVDDRPLDFRLLCHKDSYNQWRVSSYVARVSAKGTFVSNLAQGGDRHKILEVLQPHFDKNTSLHVKKLMTELAIEVASIIAIEAGGHFAELGVDIALDPSGKPWLLEINTKPSKHEESSKNNFIRPSAKAVIDHCIYLAKPTK
ncbi:YheC/YheD family endospore coat-associated protein [Bacillus salinus]|uniref:YheC/YheD family endospore coat-associated protein n=1 Tax=Bacillus sp. HMF5848 TaxID=2495421 RepID=UPI001639662E|nr:YheC/YheD family protein [Bacillus sp. HMF5848]